MSQKLFLFWLCISAICAANAQADGPAVLDRPRNIQFTLPGLLEVVQPMQHSLGGRMPLLVWDLPFPADQRLIWSRQSGALKKAVEQLAQRGIVPTVRPPGEGALALAKTLIEAGQPVYVLLPKVDVIESTVWQNCTVWAQDPDATRRGTSRKWPCLALADSKPGARWVTAKLQPLHDAGIKVTGVFFDDEALPHGYNGIYEAQVKSAECRANYPAGVLDSPAAFQQYALVLRAKLVREVMVEPVHQLFPGAVCANFDDSPSSARHPFVSNNGSTIPPLQVGSDLAMPSCYADNRMLDLSKLPLTHDQVDRTYFQVMLRSLSTSEFNARSAHMGMVPYLSRAVYGNASISAHLPMSRPAWRELLLHAWLRGSKGMFMFNLGTPGTGVTPAESFESIEDARQVYDELLADAEFLDKGEPMNLETPPYPSQEPIWSGLRLPDRCLVRALSRSGAGETLEVKAFDGVTVKLEAPAGGATYVVARDGSVTKR